jgi:hypothetical protein
VISTRVVLGVVGILVGASAVAASSLLPLPTIGPPARGVSVTPVPATKQLVCPGAVLQLGDIGGENASVASPIAQPSTTRAASTGSFESRSLQGSDGSGSAAAPQVISTVADAADAEIAGAQYQQVDREDYRGLIAAVCSQPSSDAWLVGGSTSVGRTTLLAIANPGAVSSTVAVELFGPDGAVEAPGMDGIVIGANSQRVVSLAGFAPDLESTVVHVTSRGGPVVATLQQSIVRGIEPGGVETVGSTAAPSTMNVIPGVVIRGADAIGERLGEDGFEDLRTILRFYVPGDADAQTTVRILPEDPNLEGASFDLSLDPGVVSDIPVESLTDGSYTVVVESSVPVAVAARTATVATDRVGSVSAGASDLAWFASAVPLVGVPFVAIAPGPGATLHLSNPGGSAATITVGGESVTVDAGGSAAVTVNGGETYLLEGAEGLYASVSLAAPGQLASYLLSSVVNDESPITIYLG